MTGTPQRYHVHHDAYDNSWWVIESGDTVTGLQFFDKAWAATAAAALNAGLPQGVYERDALPGHLSAVLTSGSRTA